VWKRAFDGQVSQYPGKRGCKNTLDGVDMIQTFNDCHMHLDSCETENLKPSFLLKAMDVAHIEKLALFSWYGETLEIQERNIDLVSDYVTEALDRICGLAWIEPSFKNTDEIIERVVSEKKLCGFKIIPNRWYPCDEWLLPYYERMASLNAACLFHSGILYSKTCSSKYCRPAYYEDLIGIRNFRFALAHISWPWTDECIALYGQWKFAQAAYGVTSEMFIDTCPGTPRLYREDAFRKLLDFNPDDHILFGTDMFLSSGQIRENPLNLAKQWAERIESDQGMLERLSVSEDTRAKFFHSNFERFFSAGTEDSGSPQTRL
jgi:uncharacterized protein